MNSKTNYYPVALLAIIGLAFYFLSSDGFKTGGVDLTQYQKVCDQYQAAKPGEVSREAMQSLVAKINYLIPSPLAEVTDPLQKSVKACAQTFTDRLARQEAK